MEKLKNIITGFAPQPQADEFVKKFKTKMTGHSHSSFTLTQAEAEDIFAVEGEDGSWAGNLTRFVQKHIGGGPAEFIRDVKQMGSDDRLIVVETGELSKDEVETAKSLAQSCALVQAKHFGDYSVEHLTFSDDHNAEML